MPEKFSEVVGFAFVMSLVIFAFLEVLLYSVNDDINYCLKVGGFASLGLFVAALLVVFIAERMKLAQNARGLKSITK